MGLLLALCAPPSWAEVYKWTDEQGNVHFGDRPSEDAEEVRIRKAPAAAPARTPRNTRRRLGSIMEQDRRKRAEARAKEREERDKRRSQCAFARDRLRNLSEATYLYDLDEQGQRRVLSHEQRSAAERQARQDVQRLCG